MPRPGRARAAPSTFEDPLELEDFFVPTVSSRGTVSGQVKASYTKEAK